MYSDDPSEATSRESRQSAQLRSLTVRTLDQPRPTVNVNSTIGRESGPYKEKFHSYLEGWSLKKRVQLFILFGKLSPNL